MVDAEKQAKRKRDYYADVTPDVNHWMVRVTITEEMPTFIGFKNGTRYKRYIFTDDQGNSVPVIVFGNEIPLFSNVLSLYGVYTISNADVKPATGVQLMQGYTTQWILQRRTVVRPLRGEELNLRYFIDGVTPIDLITEEMAETEAVVDIMAIVIHAKSPRSTTTQFGDCIVQNFKLVDMANKAIVLSIWDQQVEHFGPLLSTAANNYSVIVGKRIKVKDYNGPALGGSNVSSFTVAPPIEAATSLKTWFDRIRDRELPRMLADNSISSAKERLDKKLSKKRTVREILDITKPGDFWCRAFLVPTEGDERLFYVGCAACLTSVNTNIGDDYYCLTCKDDVKATMRPKVSMDVYDHSGRMTVGAIEPVAQEILGCSVDQLAEALKQEEGFDLQSIRAKFQDKMYDVLLRRTSSKRTDVQRRLLLAAFFDDDVASEQGEPSGDAHANASSGGLNVTTPEIIGKPPTTPPENVPTISPLKRQLECVTIKSGSPAKRVLFKNVDLDDEDKLTSFVPLAGTNVETSPAPDGSNKTTPA